eukprot:CAMPEP_0119358818 /NCGR_PEP_ID=MMETSP1334-20130426/6899_1 /TAXON_ID=127549 /ORGANISM="Calcidiscus leptoporus, Strain RCC1130" /LENGTH=127 /DNA_ID=CAMNT_0007373375 /DNA_START=589 /DNA_END=969 /DNA_ORIENTATION=-
MYWPMVRAFEPDNSAGALPACAERSITGAELIARPSAARRPGWACCRAAGIDEAGFWRSRKESVKLRPRMGGPLLAREQARHGPTLVADRDICPVEKVDGAVAVVRCPVATGTKMTASEASFALISQ